MFRQEGEPDESYTIYTTIIIIYCIRYVTFVDSPPPPSLYNIIRSYKLSSSSPHIRLSHSWDPCIYGTIILYIIHFGYFYKLSSNAGRPLWIFLRVMITRHTRLGPYTLCRADPLSKQNREFPFVLLNCYGYSRDRERKEKSIRRTKICDHTRLSKCLKTIANNVR